MSVSYTQVQGIPTVIVQKESRAQTFDAALFVKAGLAYETEKLSGISHFLEHSVFLGTSKFPTREAVENQLLSLGGDYNAYTGIDHTTYVVSGTLDRLPSGIEMISELVGAAALDNEKEISKERRVVLAELSQEFTAKGEWLDPEVIAHEELYRGSVLEQPILGSKKSLAKIGADELREYRNAHYTRNSVCLAVISPLPERELIPLLEKSVPWLTEGPVRSPQPVRQREVRTVRRVETESFATDLDVYWVVEDPKTALEDVVWSLLSLTLFFSERSVLFGPARKKGIAYQVHGSIHGDLGHATYNLTTVLPPTKVDAFYSMVGKQIKKLLRTGLDLEFFSLCMNYLGYRQQIKRDKYLYLAERQVQKEFLGTKSWLLEDEIEALRLATPDMVLGALWQLVSSKSCVMVLKGAHLPDNISPDILT